MWPVSPRFPFKGRFKSFLHKPFSNPFYPPPVHADPFRYRLIGISLVGKYQCLCPLPFLGVVVTPIDDCRELFPFRFGQGYPIFFFRHSFSPGIVYGYE
jgi:hypothetical protein